MAIKSVRRADGKVIGNILNGVFIKNISFRRHLFRATNAVGIDKKTFENVIRKDCKSIRVRNIDDNSYYNVTVAKFSAFGVVQDYGHEVQVFLPLKSWNEEEDRQTEMELGLKAVKP